MNSNFRHPIRMSDSTPGRIAEGEAFLHPNFFRILSLVRRKFPMNRLCFTTNGTMLEEGFVRELSRFKPVEITLSMHSTRPDLWAKITGKSSASAKKAMAALDLMRRHGIDFAGSIVPLPGVCGWRIRADLRNLCGQRCEGDDLWWPGHTVCSEPVRSGRWITLSGSSCGLPGACTPVMVFPSRLIRMSARISQSISAVSSPQPGKGM